jgi:hypothetical protein
MTRVWWWLADMVSRLLEPDECDAVRGDLAESGATGGEALRDLLGLVVRRQAALWMDWRPWLALVGLDDEGWKLVRPYVDAHPFNRATYAVTLNAWRRSDSPGRRGGSAGTQRRRTRSRARSR